MHFPYYDVNCCLTDQLMVQYFFSILIKSMANANCLVTNVTQNILFCVQQKKEVD